MEPAIEGEGRFDPACKYMKSFPKSEACASRSNAEWPAGSKEIGGGFDVSSRRLVSRRISARRSILAKLRFAIIGAHRRKDTRGASQPTGPRGLSPDGRFLVATIASVDHKL